MRKNTASNGVRAVLVRFAAVTTIVFLLFAPYLSTYFNEPTRYFTMWRRQDAVLIIAVIISLSAAAVLVGGLVRWSQRAVWIRTCEHLFVLALGEGLLANLYHYLDKHIEFVTRTGIVTVSIWFLLVSVVVYSFARQGSRLPRLATQFGLIVFPAVVIVMTSFVMNRPFDDRHDSLKLLSELRPISTVKQKDAPLAGLHLHFR